MDRRQFWKIIDASRRKANGELDAQVQALGEQLEPLPPAEVAKFQEIFDTYWLRAYRWDLWGAAYIIGGGCSDDGFMDFRAWLISRGEKAYENALRDPQTLVRVVKEEDEDCRFEGFQYVASQVWERKTGRGMDEFPRKGLKFRSSPAGKVWSEEGDDLKRRFPKLWKKFASDWT
jgi:hypothetical protein